MTTNRTPRTSQRSLAAAERRAEVCRLRREGWRIREIAEHVGVSTTQTHKDLMRELRDIPAEERDALRQLETDRLDDLWGKGYRTLQDLINAGELDKVAAILGALTRLSERRATMLGLNAPHQVEVDVGGVDYDAALAELLGGRDAD